MEVRIDLRILSVEHIEHPETSTLEASVSAVTKTSISASLTWPNALSARTIERPTGIRPNGHSVHVGLWSMRAANVEPQKRQSIFEEPTDRLNIESV